MRHDAHRITARIAVMLAVLASVSVAHGGESPAVPTIEVSPAPLTPYTSGGCLDRDGLCYRAFGRADPGIKVIVTVSDDFNPSFEITASTFALRSDDPGSQMSAGDWFVSPNVTDLGSHDEETSILTFTAVAEDSSGNRSAPSSVSVEKVAATPGDITAPRLTATKTGPPATWCHFGGGQGASQNVAGATVGACLLFTPPSLLRINQYLGNPNLLLSEPWIPGNPGFGGWGVAQFAGVVQDDTDGDFGLSSEIAEVVILIERADGTLVREIRSFTRRGTAAYYAATIFITDFEPGTYESTIYGIDAWGIKSNELKRTFTVTVL